MAFYVPTPSWQQVGTGVGVVTVRCIGTVRVAVSASAPDDYAGINYGWSSNGLNNNTLDGRGGNVWVKAANPALSPDGFFSAIWIDGVGSFVASTVLPARAYPVFPPVTPTGVAPTITTQPTISGGTTIGDILSLARGAATGTPTPTATVSSERASCRWRVSTGRCPTFPP